MGGAILEPGVCEHLFIVHYNSSILVIILLHANLSYIVNTLTFPLIINVSDQIEFDWLKLKSAGNMTGRYYRKHLWPLLSISCFPVFL